VSPGARAPVALCSFGGADALDSMRASDATNQPRLEPGRLQCVWCCRATIKMNGCHCCHVERRQLGDPPADRPTDRASRLKRNMASKGPVPAPGTDGQRWAATLRLKVRDLYAKEASPEMPHMIHELAEDIRRQVKRHREKRRKRSCTRRLVNQMWGRTAET
jgi:ribosome-associated translation inhibitor RaiA